MTASTTSSKCAAEPPQTASPGGKERRRILAGLLGAVALHAALTLLSVVEVGVSPVALASLPSPLPSLAIDIDMPRPAPGKAPGGGSADPAPKAKTKERAAQRRVMPKATKHVPLAKTEQDLPQLSELAAPEPKLQEPLTSSADVVTQASSHSTFALSTRRRAVPRQRPSATATRVAVQDSALSAYHGSGPGTRTGPGGLGAGYANGSGSGLVARAFQFGGPAGAFRADVCFIPEGTQSLRQIKSCPRRVTFYTNELNISPRSFSEGFPGVSARSEWFAIDYRGQFRVREGDHYRFRLVSDDGALLYIDGYLVIDNDGQHPPAGKEASVPLAAGPHQLRVRYYQGPRDRIALQLFVTGSDGKRRLVRPVI